MDTTIRRATPIDVLHALAPTTVFHMKVDRERVLEKLGALARRVPGYWLDAGTELEQIPPSLLELRGGMRVSVVIPAFDGERFLSDAVASVRAQECPIHEIVVVDDGSTDRTAELAERLGARVVQQQNEGPAAARNRGVQASDGEVIAFLDCDDLWTDGSLARRLDALESDPELQVVLGRHRVNISPAPCWSSSRPTRTAASRAPSSAPESSGARRSSGSAYWTRASARRRTSTGSCARSSKPCRC